MAGKTVSTVLSVGKKCKNSVRYNTQSKDGEEVLLAIYVLNDAVQELGSPKQIEVTITPKTTTTKKKALNH